MRKTGAQQIWQTEAKLPAACCCCCRTCGALDGKLAPYEVGQLPVTLHAPRQRTHALTQRTVALQGGTNK
jgi:hypothetical protein